MAGAPTTPFLHPPHPGKLGDHCLPDQHSGVGASRQAPHLPSHEDLSLQRARGAPRRPRAGLRTPHYRPLRNHPELLDGFICVFVKTGFIACLCVCEKRCEN